MEKNMGDFAPRPMIEPYFILKLASKETPGKLT